jgi:hypothetical protein
MYILYIDNVCVSVQKISVNKVRRPQLKGIILFADYGKVKVLKFAYLIYSILKDIWFFKNIFIPETSAVEFNSPFAAILALSLTKMHKTVRKKSYCFLI